MTLDATKSSHSVVAWFSKEKRPRVTVFRNNDDWSPLSKCVMPFPFIHQRAPLTVKPVSQRQNLSFSFGKR